MPPEETAMRLRSTDDATVAEQDGSEVNVQSSVVGGRSHHRDDSFADVTEDVVGLVDSNASPRSPSAGSLNTGASLISTEEEEECKQEISDSYAVGDWQHTPPLPLNYARNANSTVFSPEEATVIDTTSENMGNMVAYSQQDADDACLARAVADEEELLAALKRSAYGGGMGTTISTPSSLAQEATATIIEISDYVRATTSDVDTANTIQAEWIGQELVGVPCHATDDTRHDHAAIVVDSESQETMHEATVLDSAPLKDDDTQTQEALVLLDEDQHAEAVMDRKPAARRSSGTRRRQFRDEGHDDSASSHRSGGGFSAVAEQEAEVLGIQEDVHPAEHLSSCSTTEAELVGTDGSGTIYTSMTPGCSISGQVEESDNFAPEAVAVVATEDGIATSTIASAITSDHDGSPSITPRGNLPQEAHVMMPDQYSDRKPAALRKRQLLSSIAEQVGCDSNYEVPSGEVLNIQEEEDIHPTLRIQNGVRARLVGAEYSFASSTMAAEPSITSMNSASAASNLPPFELEQDVPTTPGLREIRDVPQDHFFDATSIGNSPKIHSVESSGHVERRRTDSFSASASCIESSITEQSTSLTTGATAAHYVQATLITAEEHCDLSQVVGASAFTDPHQPFTPDDPNPFETSEHNTPPATLNECSVGESPAYPKFSEYSSPVVEKNECLYIGQDASGITDSSQTLNSYRYDSNALTPNSMSESENRDISSGSSASCLFDSNDTSTSASQRTSMHSVAHSVGRFTNNIANGTHSVFEAFFGDTNTKNKQRHSTYDEKIVGSITPRTLLPWSVIENHGGQWIATLQTNQRALDRNNIMEASKSLRAFSMPTEKQAVCLAKSWTPPRMERFGQEKRCHVCSTKFAILKRPCHCRNCGVVVCKDCVVQVPSKMLPDTYNIKNESSVHICKSCNWLCNAFRLALLEGQHDQAVALHSTGNVNLHSPFANVKGELFYPVHCAAIGGNLSLLRFLVDDHCCPIKSVRIGSTRDSTTKDIAIVTSKGRSLLSIAMENQFTEIIRYLVVDKGISLEGEHEVSANVIFRNFEKVLRMLPNNDVPTDENAYSSHSFSNDTSTLTVAVSPPHVVEDDRATTGLLPCTPRDQSTFADGTTGRSLSEEARDFGAVRVHSSQQTGSKNNEEITNGAHADEECIICFDNCIDCVATPCGHQICCLKCSVNLNSRCPVCSAQCSFMRIYKT